VVFPNAAGAAETAGSVFSEDVSWSTDPCDDASTCGLVHLSAVNTSPTISAASSSCIAGMACE
jgi:hypothetical protein